MDLIDRKELIRQIQLQANRSSLGETAYRELTFGEVAGLIMDAPTVDAVEVVRCNDCSWSRERDEHERKYLIEGVLICTNCEANDACWNPVFPTHFCGYGERRGD